MTARTITFVILSAWLIAPSHAADLVVARYGETISHEKNDLYLSAEFRWLDPDTVAIVFENPLSIHIYDVGTKKLTQTLTLEPKDSFQAFSNDGRWLITSSHDGNWWHVYKRESGKLTHRVIAPDEPIHRFQVSPDAKRMVTQALRHHNAVRAWDLIHGRQLWSIPSPRSSGEIHFVGTRKEFQEVIVARCDVAPNRIEAREFESGNITISVGLSRNLGTYEQRSLMARLHPDQNQVICPTYYSVHGNLASEWMCVDLENAKELPQISRDDGIVYGWAISPDGQRIASSLFHSIGGIRLAEWSSGRRIHDALKKYQWLDNVCFAKNGLIRATTNGNVLTFDPTTLRQIDHFRPWDHHTKAAKPNAIQQIAFAGDKLALITQQRHLRLVDPTHFAKSQNASTTDDILNVKIPDAAVIKQLAGSAAGDIAMLCEAKGKSGVINEPPRPQQVLLWKHGSPKPTRHSFHPQAIQVEFHNDGHLLVFRQGQFGESIFQRIDINRMDKGELISPPGVTERNLSGEDGRYEFEHGEVYWRSKHKMTRWIPGSPIQQESHSPPVQTDGSPQQTLANNRLDRTRSTNLVSFDDVLSGEPRFTWPNPKDLNAKLIQTHDQRYAIAGDLTLFDLALGRMIKSPLTAWPSRLKLSHSERFVVTIENGQAVVYDLQRYIDSATDQAMPELSQTDIDEAWRQLQESDKSIATLLADPIATLRHAQQHLRPAELDPKQVQALLTKLLDDDVQVRLRAFNKLKNMDASALSVVQRFIEATTNPEAIRLAQQVNKVIADPVNNPINQFGYRVTELLQWLESDRKIDAAGLRNDVVKVFKGLSSGAPGAVLTKEAAAILQQVKTVSEIIVNEAGK